MVWYGPSPLFLLSVMTLNDVEGFRGSASVRSGLFQVGKASAKIMMTQSLMDKDCVGWPPLSMGGPALFEGASDEVAVRINWSSSAESRVCHDLRMPSGRRLCWHIYIWGPRDDGYV